MTLVDDFSPIGERGELEATTGMFGRAKRRRDLPAIDPGFVRLALDQDGGLTGQPSPGERFWGRQRGWVTVDTRPYTLEISHNLTVANVDDEFELAVRVNARVKRERAIDAAADGATSVRATIDTAVQRKLGRIFGELKLSRDGDVLAVRASLDAAMREGLVGPISEGIPDWLHAEVVTVTTHLDSATREHRTELRSRSRQRELIAADAFNELEATRGTISIREAWRAALGDQLADEKLGILEAVYADPTPENIERAAGQLRERDREHRQELLAVLTHLIDKDYIYKDDDGYKVVLQMVEALQGSLPASAGGPPIGVGKGTDEIEAEAVEEPEAPRAPDDDAHWGDR